MCHTLHTRKGRLPSSRNEGYALSSLRPPAAHHCPMERAARSVEASRPQAVTHSSSPSDRQTDKINAAWDCGSVHSALRETQVERLVGDEAAEEQVRVVVEPVEELELVEAEQHLYMARQGSSE